MIVDSQPSVSDADFPAWWRGYWARDAMGAVLDKFEKRPVRGTFAQWERCDPPRDYLGRIILSQV